MAIARSGKKGAIAFRGLNVLPHFRKLVESNIFKSILDQFSKLTYI